MTDKGLEAPDADSAEQDQDAIPDAEDADDASDVHAIPLEADQADTAEQAQVLAQDDDEYR